ncbi:HEAT repeat domain-containing protein [Microtetraspora malaysiensis]|uniref:HEAT repeat domain-containing protein n=1 Tax=Microtetraspora malaysiensis TaxID=161358 RepID=A0ABW6T3D9_9ACTN
MGDRDVLAGLDELDWAALSHAYGPADDVPGLLKALRSESHDERKRAVHELYGNIFHQGSRYQATAYAVPFLARLAVDPATDDRQEIVHLLASVAIGYDEAHLPRGVDIAGWRAEVGRMRAADPAEELRKIDEWVEVAQDEGERRVRSWRRDMFDHAESLRYAQDELGVYDAVRAEIPGLRRLLGDDDAETRSATAYLLGWFPEEAADSVLALRTLLASEIVTGVTANAIISAGLLSDAELIPRLREHLSGPEPLLRWAAAVALARLDVLDPEIIGALASASVDPPEADVAPGVHFLEGDPRAYASQTLAALDAKLPAESVDAVLEGLSRSAEVATFSMATAALRLTFGEGAPRPLPPFKELTEPQRRVVRVLAELGPETWRWGNFVEIVRAWNLPSTHAECRAYAGFDALT